MPDSTRDAWDLLPAHALDAVDDLERRAVERLLADDTEARRALDEYREVVAAFAVESEPPAHVRAAVMERISAPVADGGAPAGDDGAAPAGAEVVDLASRRRRWGVLAVAAAAVFAVAVPTTVAIQATVEQNRLQEQADTVAEMMADPSATLLRSDVTGGGYATVLAAGDDFLFSAGDLPDVGDESVYQLWLVGAEGGVTSAGLLEPQDGEVEQLVSDVSGVGLAISVEPEGGSEQPTTDPIVVLAEG
ncbi:anti-sigma factor [Isoptericola halotolerans]|uniref:anti-sigma factor n=1 Tax=Isoptericola halotolerans TaxID=300560 RepID=UPI0038906D7E